jgi:hypothetical protein
MTITVDVQSGWVLACVTVVTMLVVYLVKNRSK